MKTTYQNTVVPFPTAPTTEKTATPNQLSAHDVLQAVNDGRVIVHYQPQYRMDTDRTEGVEALVRLIDGDGNLIYPDRFIEQAEDDAVIVPLGRAVIEQSCSDLVSWRALGLELERVAVNVSPLQLELDSDLVAFVATTLQSHALKWQDLEFELTERQPLDSAGAGAAILRDLAARGSRIAVDDFGAGYASIMYLNELPITAFKLDRALIAHMGDEGILRIVERMLDMAHDRNLEVVAEGIETTAQHEMLAALGCTYGQGFGYSRPLDAAAITAWAATATPVRAALA